MYLLSVLRRSVIQCSSLHPLLGILSLSSQPVTINQSHNEVYFLVTDPILLPKMFSRKHFGKNPKKTWVLIPKTKGILIPEPVFIVSLIPDSLKNTAAPHPTRSDSRSRGCDPRLRPCINGASRPLSPQISTMSNLKQM